MAYIHRCHFCDWQREASSPTILRPNCERCGSLLDSVRADEVAAERSAEPLAAPRINLSPRLECGLRLAGFCTVLFTAAATGLHAGGPWMAVGAFGAAGLAATPTLIRG